MKNILICCIILFPLIGKAQTQKTISIYDFVKIKNNHTKEALYFYEENWKKYRDIALKKKYIVSYRLVSALPDSASDFNLILITEYADSLAYAKSEENFAQIIKETRPNGPLLLNEIKPADFRINLFYRKMETIFKSE